MATIQLADILNKRSALRKLLTNKKYHASDTAIPKDELTPEKEPELRGKLSQIAKQIVDNSGSILTDVYEDDARERDWLSLEEKIVLHKDDGSILPIDTRSRPGHKILDHYHPHFWDTKNHKGISVRGLFTQENIEKALLSNIMMHSTPYKSEIRRMIIMFGGLGNVTKFRTVTSKAIVQYFGAKRVFDPCIGWGGRMLGALSAGAEYIGCEPDKKTARGLRQMMTDKAIPVGARSRVRIIELPVEKVLNLLKTQGEQPFDMILTSPPYFNLEVYTSGDQSIQSYPTWDEWVKEWLAPVILGSIALLREGGTSCWSVKNFKSDKAYALADEVKKIHKDAGWNLVKTVTMSGSGRPGGKRINNGKEARSSEEETFCFQKKL
jgi:hypothetical protein